MCKILLTALYLATPTGERVNVSTETLSHCTRAELKTARAWARENHVRYRIVRKRKS